MTDRRELERLMADMRTNGCAVTATHDWNGWISTITITGANGIGDHAMSPLSAAERMREYLAKKGA